MDASYLISWFIELKVNGFDGKTLEKLIKELTVKVRNDAPQIILNN